MDVFEFAKQVSIEDVIGSYIDLEGPKQGHFLALCPFHGDKHLGSFKVTPSKGIFKCWACGEEGDGIAFVSKYLNISPFAAAVRICETHGIISKETAERILGGTMLSRDIVPMKMPKKVEQILSKRRPLKDLSLAYTAFVNAAGHNLSLDFIRVLTEERKLAESELSEYFTWPRNTAKFWNAFRNELTAAGIKGSEAQDKFLLGVPGFYQNAQGTISFVTSRKAALGIPVKNRDGIISGLQLRQMEPVVEGESRYRFLSSAFANGRGSSRGRYGCSCGYVESVEYPRKRWNKTIALTEGHFKAITLAKMGFLVVNMHGISNWRPAGDVALDLAARYPKTNRFLLVFDSETTSPVEQSKQGLAEKLKSSTGNTIAVEAAVWDPQYGKGIDDVVNAGNTFMVSSQQI